MLRKFFFVFNTNFDTIGNSKYEKNKQEINQVPPFPNNLNSDGKNPCRHKISTGKIIGLNCLVQSKIVKK